MENVDLRRNPWRAERAAAAAGRPFQVPLPAPRVTAMSRDFRGQVNGPAEFALCSNERRLDLLASLLKLISYYADRAPEEMGQTEAELLASLMNLYAGCAHVILREAAIALESRSKLAA